jgi:putative membrane protein
VPVKRGRMRAYRLAIEGAETPHPAASQPPSPSGRGSELQWPDDNGSGLAYETDMRGFLIRVLVVAAGLWVASKIVRGVEINDGWTLLWAALILGIVNAIVRPVVIIMTLPLTILTLGLFLLVVNAAMLSLVAWMLGGMTVSGFWSALFGAIVVSLVGWAVTSFVGDRGSVEKIEFERM